MFFCRRFSSHVGWNERGYPSIAGNETKHHCGAPATRFHSPHTTVHGAQFCELESLCDGRLDRKGQTAGMLFSFSKNGQLNKPHQMFLAAKMKIFIFNDYLHRWMSDVRNAPSHEKYSAAGIVGTFPVCLKPVQHFGTWSAPRFFFVGKQPFVLGAWLATRYVYQCTTGDHQRSNPGSALSASAIRDSRWWNRDIQ